MERGAYNREIFQLAVNSNLSAGNVFSTLLNTCGCVPPVCADSVTNDGKKKNVTKSRDNILRIIMFCLIINRDFTIVFILLQR